MAIVTYGEGSEASDVQSIPEVQAICKVTGGSLQEALDTQVVAARDDCPIAACGALAVSQMNTHEGSEWVDPGMYVDHVTVSLDIKIGCDRNRCPDSAVVRDLLRRIEVLPKVCQDAIDEAEKEAEVLTADTRKSVAEIMEPAQAQVKAILEPAQERAKALEADRDSNVLAMYSTVYGNALEKLAQPTVQQV